MQMVGVVTVTVMLHSMSGFERSFIFSRSYRQEQNIVNCTMLSVVTVTVMLHSMSEFEKNSRFVMSYRQEHNIVNMLRMRKMPLCTNCEDGTG